MHSLLRLIQSVDLSVYYFLSRGHGNWFLDRLAALQESNALLKSVPLLAAYLYFWFRNGQKQQEQRISIVVSIAGTLVGLFVARMLGTIVPFRIRPMYDPHIVHVPLSLPIPADFVDWSSFPSDHAACFCALGFGLIWLSRRLVAPVTLFLLECICLARLYLGIHYASDIVVGAGIGMGTVLLLLRSEWAATLAHPLVALADTRPQLFYPFAFLLTFEMATLFWDARTLVHALLHVTTTGPHHRVISGVLMLLVSICVVAAAIAYGRARRSKPAGQLLPMPKAAAQAAGKNRG